eukprot:gnl/MRDRNA2_/MRDRNA2_121178_c0_seq1.p1 gnl/MRDRNA2_/MRDRNA2_121178_c0~~gnl/MRDRNA2_/MRDRNA2_121178_c0_seq1.p1  ORF type:complete len:201 (-),score=37.61 gnl/MRDRNA2_/MRDRNA2_121178_c0_seq1:146-667(-)
MSFLSIGRSPVRALVAGIQNRAFSSVVNLAVHGKGTGVGMKIDTGCKTHSFSADALPVFGGADSAPSPLYYVLAGLGSCNQVTGSLVAKDLGIKLGKWEVDVHAKLDVAVLTTGAEGNANFDAIEGKIRVETDADSEQLAKLAAETERRCPISQLYKRSGLKFDIKWEAAPLP